MEKNNGSQYDKAIQMLGIRDEDRILEIGFGSGLAIRRITEKNTCCRIEGLDFSSLMLNKARKNNRQAVAQKRVELHFGDLKDFEFGSKTFTKIFGINVIYFWEDLGGMCTRLHGLLAPAGRLILCMSSPERLGQIPFAVKGVFNKYPWETVLAALQKAGFNQVSKETALKKGLETYYICAEK
jgi:ubiquinone/menaquinone biosynthesis C-methylase UbiE